jgi:hypothetical protein
MFRVAASFATLPLLLWAGVAYAPWLLGVNGTQPPLGTALATSFWPILFTYLAMGLIGVPLLLLFARSRLLRIWHLMLVGGLVALLCIGLPVLLQMLDTRLHLQYRMDQLAKTVHWVLLGMAAGGLFWLMAVWRNPYIGANLEAATNSSARGAA